MANVSIYFESSVSFDAVTHRVMAVIGHDGGHNTAQEYAKDREHVRKKDINLMREEEITGGISLN